MFSNLTGFSELYGDEGCYSLAEVTVDQLSLLAPYITYLRIYF